MIVRLCLASNFNIDQLRSQLNQLRRETVETSTKANSARLRLLRLSEAAEKLRQQAAKSVQVGKENDARDLLLQKKKILQAMEKLKSRIETLDELASKLNEAISIKERHLIGKVASDFELASDTDGSPVRIVSPAHKVGDVMDSVENNKDITFAQTQNEGRSSQFSFESEMDTVDNDQMMCDTALDSINSQNNIDILGALRRISSYYDFLEHLDEYFYQIEAELTAFLRLISMALEEKEKSNNLKVKRIVELLDKVRDIRGSINKFSEEELGN